MNDIKRYSPNKRGATTVFLAIVLSAIILVECTYVGIVVENDRRLAYNRAVKEQVETILADYDRELFRTYGIYAFDMNTVDDSVYNNVLEASGIEAGAVLITEGMNSFDTDDLHKAIATFYTYRLSGVLFHTFENYLRYILDYLDSYGILSNIRSFMSSEAADYIGDILSNSEEISDFLSDAANFVGIDNVEEKIQSFSDFFGELIELSSSQPNYADGISITNLNSFTSLIDNLYSLADTASEISSEWLSSPMIAHYGAYNFDSRLQDDCAINGTGFDTFHDGNIPDSEYILTGLEGDEATLATSAMIFPMVLLFGIINIVLDSETMEVITGIAEVLMVVIAFATGGAVILSAEIYEAVIIGLYAISKSCIHMNDLINGGSLEIVTIENFPLLSASYRDFVFFYMCFVSDDKLLNRISIVLSRDFEDYYSCISVSVNSSRFILSACKTYALYS